uniref:Uncharacterized protein n=1 Tax=viral metagenome TaxID=1070528 RepID=A0A6M3JHM6_9ZZZZ
MIAYAEGEQLAAFWVFAFDLDVRFLILHHLRVNLGLAWITISGFVGFPYAPTTADREASADFLTIRPRPSIRFPYSLDHIARSIPARRACADPVIATDFILTTGSAARSPIPVRMLVTA